ncbi:site-2 protease family protein [Actinomadura livida]|uniref:Zinc metalloprotease n=1 Tax=Actinomadura livida TaxID=79909 RepID=A0A7W7IE87_9ACTN|nr:MULTISPECIES: site-2 protease family protein [Actinomadura]MBB4775457.1 Zn-dependent protease [Actinomadura catellatispora]GGT90458.1 peptidase M50 [Actinomadura livida]
MTRSAPPTEDKTPATGPGPGGGGPRPGILMGRPFGIPVYVSPSWFLVAALITILFEGQVNDVVERPLSYLVAFAYAVLLYGSVFIHELSHAVTARAFHLPVRSVTLHLLGGETAIEREAPTPGREFLIAFAGPLVNLVLAGLGILAHILLPLPDVALLLVDALAFANLLVGLFNLLPGLPLDGGRLVRAAVWKATGRSRSGAIIAGWVGRGVAIACLVAGAYLATYGAAAPDANANGGIGWLALLWSALVASFIWVGATQALRAERVRDRIPHLDARGLARRATLVTADVPLAEAIRRAQHDQAGAIVIADHEGRPLGLVNEKAVTATPEHRRPWISAGELSRGIDGGLTLSADLSGEDLIEALRRTPASEYLLVEPDGSLYGVLATTDVDKTFTGI